MTKPKVSDEAVRRATGRDWAEWCQLLDSEGARDMAHPDIASLVHDKFKAPPWWSQMVSVGYEQIRGLRVLHQKGAAFEISRSKTFAAPVARVYRAWTSAADRKRWLSDPEIDVTRATANKSVRFAWVDGKTRAEASFVDKGDKTAVTVAHFKLGSATAASRMKVYWGRQLENLSAHLESLAVRRRA